MSKNDLFRFSVEWQDPVTQQNEGLDRMPDASESINEWDLLSLQNEIEYGEPIPTWTVTPTPSLTPTETVTTTPTATPTPTVPVSTPFYDKDDAEWPAVATDPANGDYVLAFKEDGRVRWQKFDDDGSEIGDEGYLERETNRPDVFIDPADGYLWILYEDDDGSDRGVRLYHEKDPNTIYHILYGRVKYPSIAVTRTSEAACVFVDEDRDPSNDISLVRFARYDRGEVLLGKYIYYLSEDGASRETDIPEVAINGRDDFLAVWKEENKRIEGTFIEISNLQFDDDERYSSSGCVPSGFPRVTALEDDYFLVYWEDSRSGQPQVYARIADDQGRALGESDFRVDDTPGLARKPSAVAFEDNQKFLIVWSDDRAGGSDQELYGRLVDPERRQPEGQGFFLGRAKGPIAWIDAVASKRYEGEFLVAWQDDDGVKAGLYRIGF